MNIKRSPFPPWLRRAWPSGETFDQVKSLLDGLELHTVCQSAQCPNQAECWGRGTATMMVLGNVCTRHCTYCAVNSGHPDLPDADEPQIIAEAVQRLQLKHMVITSVTRDDLPDGGAAHIADTIRAIKQVNPATTIEVLVQDFDGKESAIQTVIDARSEVFSHNIETVETIFPKLRDRRFTYRQSLQVLSLAASIANGTLIKSAFMLGCGETHEDVRATLVDLKEAGCNAVSIGQYLQPTPKHYDVVSFIAPEQFKSYEQLAFDLGFDYAVAGPFVRSSYRSEELLKAPKVRARLNP